MFKSIITVIFILSFAVESFRNVLSSTKLLLTPEQKSFYTVRPSILYQTAFILYFNKLVGLNTSTDLLFMFTTACLFTAAGQNKFSETFNMTSLALLSLFGWWCFNNFNIFSFIVGGELISISLIFLLFFNSNPEYTRLNYGVFYFLVSGAVTLLIGVILVSCFLCFYGSLNTHTLVLFFEIQPNNTLCILMNMYTLLKLGQGPVVFVKFRFYRATQVVNLVYYVCAYVILLWPFLFYILLNFEQAINSVYLVILLISTSLYLLNSVFFFSSIADFLVFSTWTYTWYQLFYIFA